MSEILSDSPTHQEILWNFSRFKDEKKRLTLTENPYFYETYQLPTSPEKYDDKFQVHPTKDFWFARSSSQKLYVLTDKPEPVYIMTDSLRSFGNFWCPKNAIIFKGSGHLFLFFSVYLMSFQTSVGGSGEKPSSRILSKAHPVGSVSNSRCPPFQELPGIVMDCNLLLHRGAH